MQSPDGGTQPAPPPANSAPVISGSPPAEVQAGSAYSFTPGADDGEAPGELAGDLGFAIPAAALARPVDQRNHDGRGAE